MKEFALYRIDYQYLKYIQQFDKLVPQKDMRPYVSICIEVANNVYALPITSQRLRSNGKKRNPRTTTELYSPTSKDFGAILYNNMIPVTDDVANLIDFNTENAVNRQLLKDKAIIIRKMSAEISEKAQDVYKLRCSEKDDFFNRFCCDFKLLEQKLYEYMKIQNLSKPLDLNINETNLNLTEAAAAKEPGPQPQAKLSLSERLAAARAKADELNKQNHTENLHKNPNNVNLE